MTDGEIGDLIIQVSDNWVPVDTDQLLELAKESSWLVSQSPQRMTFSSSTPIRLLSANIYEYLNDELWKRYNEE